MKKLAITVAAALVFIGCQHTRVTSLEKRVDRLEQTVQQLETNRTRAEESDSSRQQKLESCVADANAAFDRNMVNNGTKQRDGSYNVPVPILTEMQRVKQGKIEECRLLYSK